MSLVEINNLNKSFKSGVEITKVLRDLNLNVETAEMIMIMGPSGSGKTTLLNMLGGIDNPDNGNIKVADLNLATLDTKKLNKYRREKVGFIFQFYNLIPTLTARENIELGLESILNNKKEIKKRALKYLKLVGLKDKENNFPQELSGGEQQRVAVARSLAKEPKIILADEPTGNLDEDREKKIMELMKSLQNELGITFMIVSHNTRLKAYMTRTLVLRNGKLLEEN